MKDLNALEFWKMVLMEGFAVCCYFYSVKMNILINKHHLLLTVVEQDGVKI